MLENASPMVIAVAYTSMVFVLTAVIIGIESLWRKSRQ